MVGELHRVHRPHLYAQTLQREYRCGIADMAVGDVRLDGEDIHSCNNNRHGGEVPRHVVFTIAIEDYFIPIFLLAASTNLLV